jgi:hypothetical protein
MIAGTHQLQEGDEHVGVPEELEHEVILLRLPVEKQLRRHADHLHHLGL